MKDVDKLSVFFGKLFLLVATVIGGVIMGGWVLTKLWSWFVAPFFDFGQLNISTAIGFYAVLVMLIPILKVKSNDGDVFIKQMGALFMRAFFAPLFLLFVGYSVSLIVEGKVL